MMSALASEVAKYPKSCPTPKYPKMGSRKRCEICTQFHRLYRKKGSPSKNMMSDFLLEVAKYPQNHENPQIAKNGISITKRDRREICHIYRKSGSPSKNMTSDFALKLAKYPKSGPKLQNSPKWGVCEPNILPR